jgi:hypothetical protein
MIISFDGAERLRARQAKYYFSLVRLLGDQ